MKSGNVIISLLLVLVLFVFAFIKIRFWEPGKKPSFKRNTSHIGYTPFALCRMDCYNLDANIITAVLRQGEVTAVRQKDNCAVFTLQGSTKQGRKIFVVAGQCGAATRITDCYDSGMVAPCPCAGNENPPVSYFKKQ